MDALRLKIGLLEDDTDVSELMKLWIEAAGHECKAYGDGESFIGALNDSEFDLVILDMLMPKLPGDEVFERLQELDPEVRVLVISGFSSREAVDKILRNGGLGFIQKPFTMKELSGKIREILDKK